VKCFKIKKTSKRLKVEEVEEKEAVAKKTSSGDAVKDATEKKEEEKVGVEVKEESDKDEPKTDVETKEETPNKKDDDPKISSFAQVDVEKNEKVPSEEKEDNETSKDEVQKEETLDLSSEKKDDEKEKASTPTDDKPEEEKEKAENWLSDVKPEENTEEEGGGGGKKKVFFIILILVIIAGIVAGGVYYYQTNMSGDVQVTETVIQEEAAPVVVEDLDEEDATGSAEIDQTKYLVNILNGSGVAGEAGKVAVLLNDLEFDTVDTSNAQSYDYIGTEVWYKESVDEETIESIKSSIEEDYIVTEADENLDDDHDYDIEIIVGSKKAESS
jgi:hypothetical protein